MTAFFFLLISGWYFSEISFHTRLLKIVWCNRMVSWAAVYFIQIVKIQEATVQEEVLLNQIVRSTPDLGPLTAGKGFRSEIGMTTIESETETGEREDRETGIETEMLTKTGQGAGSERDSENARERGKREGSWKKRGKGTDRILVWKTHGVRPRGIVGICGKLFSTVSFDFAQEF